MKRVEAQWAQAAILNDITESCQFNKIKMTSKAKGSQARQMTNTTSSRWLCRYCGRIDAPQQCPAYGKMCARCGKMGHYKKVCRSKRDHAVHELEVKMVQDSQDKEIETVSVDSVHLNKNRAIIMVYLDTYAGEKQCRNTIQNRHS